MNPKLPLAALLTGFTMLIHAQTANNPCGVISQFTPNRDSVLTSYAQVTFTSTSINAASVGWYIDGIYYGTNPTQVFGFNTPGTYAITLIAKKGTCADTSVCYYIYPGTQPPNRKNIKSYYGFPTSFEESAACVATPDSGYLLAGNTSLYAQSVQQPYRTKSGFITKISPSGCVQWTRVMQNNSYGVISGLFALPDSTYGITGADDGNYVRVIDATGNLKWNKNLKKNGYFLAANAIGQSADKGYVLMSNQWESGLNVFKLDANAGLVWSRLQYKPDATAGFNYINPSMVVRENDIYIAATSSQQFSNISLPVEYHTVVLKIDANTGQTRWRKIYKVNNTDVYAKNIENRGDGLVLNTTLSNADNHIIYLDTAGNMLSSRALSANGLNATTITSNVKVRSNGDLYILNQGSSPLTLQPYITYKANCILLDKDFNVKWSYYYGAYAKGRFYYHAIGTDGTFAAAGDEYGSVIPAFSSWGKIMFKKLDTAGTILPQYNCEFFNAPLSIYPTTTTTQTFANTADSNYTIEVANGPATLLTQYAQVRYMCPTEFIDSCSVLKVTGPGAICNLSATYTYHLHRNRTCNQPPLWQINPAATVIAQSNSAITVRFTAMGRYTVSALFPYACTPIKDSVTINVNSRSPVLSLGPDTTLCPGNTLLADAGAGFYSYEWQDGSTGRAFTVTGPGTYWVKVTDSCSNIFRDTLQVALSAAVSINAGADRFKCNSDTLHLEAPLGFLQYQWSPNYQISATNTAAVTVNPLVDTSYFIRVEKSPGCYGYDTIRVQVHRSPAIRLGNDTSICTGTTVLLNAGTAFASYTWNTGATTASINVSTAGVYQVTGTDALGCRSSDTFRIVDVYPLPVVQLAKDSLLCIGNSRTLDAGAGFATYNWNTGSTAQAIRVAAAGSYSVQVTNIYNCRGTDSTRITRILPLPSGFLPDEPVQICSYEKATLQPVTSFNQYSWSNGATTSNITVSAPGSYWLKVIDRYNCTGTDTATVLLKACIKGAYFPSAFTPNYDGRNDRFLPLLYGTVTSYQLNIYNRYGETIFSSTNATLGWDGRYKGSDAEAGAYIWQCNYRFEGGEQQMEKGTLLLIR